MIEQVGKSGNSRIGWATLHQTWLCWEWHSLWYVWVSVHITFVSDERALPQSFHTWICQPFLLNHAISQCLVGSSMYGHLLGNVIQWIGIILYFHDQRLYKVHLKRHQTHSIYTVLPHKLLPKDLKQIFLLIYVILTSD